MFDRLTVGRRVPPLRLGRYASGAVEAVRLDQLLQGGKAILIGVPGAFTPPCTQQHVPDLVRNAPKLRAGGFRQLICVAPNDPFTLHAWSAQIDPGGEILFLSDGNRELARALMVEADHSDWFLGRSTQRYLLTVDDLKLTHFVVEPAASLVRDTRPSTLI